MTKYDLWESECDFSNEEELHTTCHEYPNLAFRCTNPKGPGGGWPTYVVIGPKDEVDQFLEDNGYDQDSEPLLTW